MYRLGLGTVMAMLCVCAYGMEEFGRKALVKKNEPSIYEQYRETQEFHNKCAERLFRHWHLQPRQNDAGRKTLLTGTSAHLLTVTAFIVSALLSKYIAESVGISDPSTYTSCVSLTTLAATGLTHRLLYTQRTPEGQLKEVREYITMLERWTNDALETYTTCKNSSSFARTLQRDLLIKEQKGSEEHITSNCLYLKIIEESARAYRNNRHIRALEKECQRAQKKINSRMEDLGIKKYLAALGEQGDHRALHLSR